MSVIGLLAAVAASGAPGPVLTNSIGMELVLVSPGEMQVGVFTPTCPGKDFKPMYPPAKMTPEAEWGPADQAACEKAVQRDRRKGFKVRLTHALYVGRYEVTQAQWRKVMGANPSVFQGQKAEGDSDSRPVDSVSWADAKAFVRKLNTMEHTQAYRLPTEFEWEYACRAGDAGQQSWAAISHVAQGIDGFGRAAGSAKPVDTTGPVGGKAPNAWGLYDMLGNVWEWVADSYNEDLFADPKPKFRTSGEHVLKGGSFTGDVKNTICASHAGGPGDRWNVGFRVVRDAR
jgi:sulfatase modifying factor 1